MPVDGFRFLDPGSRRVMRAWCEREEPPEHIPWTPLSKPLSASRVALVSTAGIAHRDDQPFDQEGERRNPWWGDPTHRVLPRGIEASDVAHYHLHIDPRPASRDLDCLLPLRRLDELVVAGDVGSSAANHYSIMGYILRPGELLDVTAPKIVEGMKSDEVDFALMVPV